MRAAGELDVHMRRFFLGFIVLVVVATAGLLAPAGRATASHPQWDEWDFLNLINRERYERGMPALAMAPPARDVARAWSGVMASEGRLFHNPDFSSQLGARITNWRRAGENVGVGGSVTQLHQAFMNSPGHRDNILGSFQWAGVGVRWSDGRLWVTVNFVATSGGTAWETRTPLTRLAAASDSDSSVLVSRRVPGGSAAGVVVARSDQFADALAGAPLASAHGGSVLLVPPDRVPSNVLDEIRRVMAPGGRIMILGGPGAVGAGAEADLRGLGMPTERIAGPDRWSTAAAIAPRVSANPGRIFVVSGQAFPDATSAAAVAAGQKAPILLVGPNAVPAATNAYLATQAATEKVVVGGPAAVSDAVVGAVRASRRVHGADRYATSVNLANTYFPSASRVVVAPGGSFADALVAGPEAARLGGPLILTAPSPNSFSYGYIGTQNRRWTAATTVGDAGEIPDSALALLFS
jgi:putative cell wall-binding protein